MSYVLDVESALIVCTYAVYYFVILDVKVL